MEKDRKAVWVFLMAKKIFGNLRNKTTYPDVIFVTKGVRDACSDDGPVVGTNPSHTFNLFPCISDLDKVGVATLLPG